MPRTQVTICGAPNAIAMPKIAPMHHPHDIRLAIAIPPRIITRIIATGVSQARMLVCRDEAPVKNGDACAQTHAGTAHSARALRSAEVLLWRRRRPAPDGVEDETCMMEILFR